MPLKWDIVTEAPDQTGAFCFSDGAPPLAHLVLWPHRSLPRTGFVAFIGITFVLILLPAVALLGTLALWALLPFLLGTVALLWYFLERNYADGSLREDLTLWSDRIELVRSDRHDGRSEWQANPFWVEIELHETGGPVENYVTLKGGGRQVEIGAFLSPDERAGLHDDLQDALAMARAAS